MSEEQLWPEEIPPISAPVYANICKKSYKLVLVMICLILCVLTLKYCETGLKNCFQSQVARQTNGNDCGVFVCEFGRRLTEGVMIITSFRTIIIHVIDIDVLHSFGLDTLV